MKSKFVWRGITAILVFILSFLIVGTILALGQSGVINSALNISTTKVIPGDPAARGDVYYYKSEYGAINAENLGKLNEDLSKQGTSESEEGSVLLLNREVEGAPALPLKEGERNVALFGVASANPVLKYNSAGSSPTWVSYEGALSAAGFRYDVNVMNALRGGSKRANGVSSDPFNVNVGEAPVSIYTESMKNTWRSSYNDAAIVMLSRFGGEDSELLMDMSQSTNGNVDSRNKDGRSQLALQAEEEDMLKLVQEEKAAGHIKKIIVLINSGNVMELGKLEDYGVDAALWIGCPGSCGFTGVVNLLTGKANPSGKLPDLYPVNSLAAPANVNAGTLGTKQVTNVASYISSFTDEEKHSSYYNVRAEGIYIGYKYFETRYEDVVLGQGGADSDVGSSTGESWAWEDEVVYPFGYGLSYTDFEQTLVNVSSDENADTMTVEVNVKNTGTVAGKSVVQVYAQTPYNDYERENLVEKSAVQLVGFDKTGTLEPGASESVNVTVDKYLLASYDSNNAKGYILSEGDYYLAIGDDSHDALNNILAKKAPDAELVGVGGVAADGDARKVHSWYEVFNTEKYRTSRVLKESAEKAGEYTWQDGEVVTNRFDDCDANYWNPDSVTYLTRGDWEDTYPEETAEVAMTDEMLPYINGGVYEKPENAKSVNDYTFGANNGLNFVTMRNVPYDDTVTWDKYLDQYTLDELVAQVEGLQVYNGSDSVNKPAPVAGDGPDGGINGDAYALDEDGDLDANGNREWIGNINFGFAVQTVLGATFNPDLMLRRGELVGEIGLYVRKCMSFAPGGNIHRTNFGGRNFEYFSEDPTLCYFGGYYFSSGMNSKGVLAGTKHVTGNDQEYIRHGSMNFFTEQALRETSLRAEEGSIRLAGSKLLMGVFNRLGPHFGPSYSALHTGVISDEWGFRGIQETDAVQGLPYAKHYEPQIAAGICTFCMDNGDYASKAIQTTITSNDDGYLVGLLRERVKNIDWALSRSSLINGIADNDTVVSVTPWWETTLYVMIGVFSALTLGAAVMLILTERGVIGKKGGAV